MRQTIDYTADAAVRTARCNFYGIFLVTDGTNAVTLNIYDNASAASGTTILPADIIITTSATDRGTLITLPIPILCANGIYVDITTGGAVTYKVFYDTVQ